MRKFVVEIARGTTKWCQVLSIFIGSLLSLTFRVFLGFNNDTNKQIWCIIDRGSKENRNDMEKTPCQSCLSHGRCHFRRIRNKKETKWKPSGSSCIRFLGFFRGKFQTKS